MKCFSDFAKVLKKATFNKNNERFFNDLFYAVTDYNSEEDDNPIEKEDRTNKSKYVSGERPISSFLDKINKRLFANQLSDWLSDTYPDIFSNSISVERIHRWFKNKGMPLNEDNLITDEIENLFSDIIFNYSDVLPHKKECVIVSDKKKKLTDSKIDIKRQLKNGKEQIANQQKINIPIDLRKDFKLGFEGDDLKLLPITKDAYEKFPLNLKVKVYNTNPNFEKFKDFRKIFNEANLNGYAELGSLDEVKDYLGNIPHPLSEFEGKDLTKIKWFIEREQNPQEIIVDLKVNNKYNVYAKKGIKLQLLSIDKENGEYIYSNKWFDEWFNAVLTIKAYDDYKNYNFTYGVREEYFNDLRYYKEIYKYLFLLKDKNATITLHETTHDLTFIDTYDFGEYDWDEKANEHQKEDIELMNWLLETQESNNCKLNFDINEYIKERATILILYNASNNRDTILNGTMTLTIPNNHNLDLEEKNLYHFGGNFDYISLFGEHLNLYLNKSLNIIGYIKEINDKQIKIKFKEVWLRDSIHEIENNQLALATYEQDFLNSNKEKLLVN